MNADAKPLTQEQTEHQALIDYAFKGKPLDPEIQKRVRERADIVRNDLRKRGLTFNAVELIHESRNDL